MAKTISFPKGKGSLRHNNRDFISSNVDESRTPMNVYFIQEPLRDAYEKCFGQALSDYNAKQKRKDRIKDDYISEIKNSGNGEKVFYENVVQIGDMHDTGIPTDGQPMTQDVLLAKEILSEYVHTFAERNPNLYLFNAVLHMDEATPHLHLDYIPVAHGYKKGLETRNSLTKALQEQGIAKAVSKERNETVFWQERERKYIAQLCAERGIEIYEKGEKRDNLTLPEFKQVMGEVNDLRERAEELRIENAGLVEEQEDIRTEIKAAEQVRDELIAEAEDAEARVVKAEELTDDEKAVVDHNKLTAKYLQLAEDALAETPEKPVAKHEVNALGKTTGYVKVEEAVWSKVLRIFRVTKTREKALEKMSADISEKDNKINRLTTLYDKCKAFLKEHGLLDEFLATLQPKKRERVSLQKRIDEKKVVVAERDAYRTPQQRDKLTDIAI